MTSVAVVAHRGKKLGKGLAHLRHVLAEAGIEDPPWYEVSKSRQAPKRVRAAIEAGVDVLLVWGGDGMVQRCIDAAGDAPVAIGILPAGTANLLATNLGIPTDLEAAVQLALHGRRRPIDVGSFNGQRFAVMAGAGWDALMIRDAGGALKRRLGRAAYVVAGAKHLRAPAFHARITVDRTPWFEGEIACLLVGNVPKAFGGLRPFDDAVVDDGRLELGIVTAAGALQLARVLARTTVGSAAESPFVRVTKARRIRVTLDRKVDVELDGGHRGTTRKIKVDVVPHGVEICVPDAPEEAT